MDTQTISTGETNKWIVISHEVGSEKAVIRYCDSLEEAYLESKKPRKGQTRIVKVVYPRIVEG